jgi:heterodisulfide reductase subunit C2
MAITIKKSKKAESLIHRVEQMTGQEVGTCFQCKKCTAGCPVSKLTNSPTSEIMRRLHLKAGDELLHSEIIWMCVSCETCSARCPMGIDVAAVIDSLRQLSREKKIAPQKGNVPLFNRAFLETVKFFGRTYDIAMITAYKLGTFKFMDDTEKFPSMLKKKKISLLPSFQGDGKITRRIFKKAKERKEAGK